MQWKFEFAPKLGQETKREILKKPFFKKEPFAKVSIHQMHIADMVEQLLESGLRIHIDTNAKEILILPSEEEN